MLDCLLPEEAVVILDVMVSELSVLYSHTAWERSDQQCDISKGNDEVWSNEIRYALFNRVNDPIQITGSFLSEWPVAS